MDMDDSGDFEITHQELADFQQSTNLLLQLYTQNKLTSVQIWDWGFTHNLHKYILAKSQRGEAVNINDAISEVDFSEKAAIIDATSTIYGYKVQNLFDSVSRTVDTSASFGGALSGEDADADAKKKKEKKKDLPPTVEDSRFHTLQPDYVTPYDLIFTQTTQGLSNSLGIRTLLCYNSKTQPHGVNTICSLDTDLYGLLPNPQLLDFHANLQKVKDNEEALEQRRALAGSSPRSPYDVLTESINKSLNDRIQTDLDAFQVAKADQQENFDHRVSLVLDSGRYTLFNAMDLKQSGVLPSSVTEQIDHVSHQLNSATHAGAKNAPKSRKSLLSSVHPTNSEAYGYPPLYIPLDDALQLFVFDVNAQSDQFSKRMASSQDIDGTGRSFGPDGDSPGLLSGLLAGLDAPTDQQPESSAVIGGLRRTKKDEAEMEQLTQNAHDSLDTLMSTIGARGQISARRGMRPAAGFDQVYRDGGNPAGAQAPGGRARKSIHLDMDDEIGSQSHYSDDDSHRAGASNPASQNDLFALITPGSDHPVYFSQGQLSRLLNVSRAARKLSVTARIPQLLLSPFLHANGAVMTKLSELFSRVQLITDVSSHRTVMLVHASNQPDIPGEFILSTPTRRSKGHQQVSHAASQDMTGDSSTVIPENTTQIPLNPTLTKNAFVASLLDSSYDEAVLSQLIPPRVKAVLKMPLLSGAALGPKKRQNTFDFSKMASGVLHNLFDQTEFNTNDEYDDTYYLSTRDRTKHRHSLQDSIDGVSDAALFAQLDSIGSDLATGSSGSGLVQLGHTAGQSMTFHPGMAPTTTTYSMDISDMSQGEVYSEFEFSSILQQHDQRKEEVYEQHKALSKSIGQTQRQYLDKIRSNELLGDVLSTFDNQDDTLESYNGQMSESAASTANAFFAMQFKTNESSLARSMEHLVTSQLRGQNPLLAQHELALQQAAQSSRRRPERKARSSASAMGEDEKAGSDDDSDRPDDSESDAEAAAAAPKVAKKMTPLQLNLLRRQRSMHREYQRMLQTDSSVVDGGRGSKKTKQSMDDDLFDPPGTKAKKIVKKSVKVNTLDIIAIIKGDGLPTTPGLSSFLAVAPELTVAQRRGANVKDRSDLLAVTTLADGSSQSNMFVSLLSTLEPHAYRKQRANAEAIRADRKKLTKKQESFLKQQEIMFQPDTDIENAIYSCLVAPNYKSNTITSQGSSLTANAAAQKNLLADYVSPAANLTVQLLTLNTRSDIMLQMQNPSNTYALSTASNIPINVLVEQPLRHSGRLLMRSTNADQKARLLRDRAQSELKQQQTMHQLMGKLSTGEFISETDLAEHIPVAQGAMRTGPDGRPLGSIDTTFLDGSGDFGSDFFRPLDDFDGMDQQHADSAPQAAPIDPGIFDDDDDGLGDDGDLTGGATRPGNEVSFDDLSKMLDAQNQIMLQKQAESGDFLKQLQASRLNDYDNDENGEEEMAESSATALSLGSLMSKYMSTANPDSSLDMYSYDTQQRLQQEKMADPFRMNLDAYTQQDVLKHATVSKYFNIRHLKQRLFSKLTTPTLKRVFLTNLRALAEKQANTDASRQRSRDTGTVLPELPKDARAIEAHVISSEPNLRVTETGIAQHQQIKGGQAGSCLHTTFKHLIGQIQYDYSNYDVRSISTFFLSLLILSNETNLELRPCSLVETNSQSVSLVESTAPTSHLSAPDPLTIGYSFDNFDIFVPVNAKDAKNSKAHNAE